MNDLEGAGYLGCNCGFLTTFDMEYELGCDDTADFILKIRQEGDGTIRYILVDVRNNSVLQSTEDFEDYLVAVAAVFEGYNADGSSLRASFNSCSGDPFVSQSDKNSNFDCRIGGRSVGGNFRFRFDNASDRDIFCVAVEAMIGAKWLAVNGFYNGGTPCYGDGITPCP